jgi:DNA-binding SARP family transcriptional activator
MAHPADGKRLITLFGGAAIRVGSVPVGGRAAHRHPIALVALLVAGGGRAITRDKIIALLWPERDADGARNLLKVNVHELRKEIGERAIRSTGDQLSADLAELSCDVADFAAALERGDDRAAADLYAGPFLDGFFLKDAADFERWADAERTRFGAMYASALERLADASERAGDLESAVQWRRKLAAHDPYRPDVARRLVGALAASGDRAGAIQFAESFVERRRVDL